MYFRVWGKYQGIVLLNLSVGREKRGRMARAGVLRRPQRAYFRFSARVVVMKFYMKSFDFSDSLSSFLAVQFVQAATSGEDSLDTFNRFHAREMDHF